MRHVTHELHTSAAFLLAGPFLCASVLSASVIFPVVWSSTKLITHITSHVISRTRIVRHEWFTHGLNHLCHESCYIPHKLKSHELHQSCHESCYITHELWDMSDSLTNLINAHTHILVSRVMLYYTRTWMTKKNNLINQCLTNSITHVARQVMYSIRMSRSCPRPCFCVQ